MLSLEFVGTSQQYPLVRVFLIISTCLLAATRAIFSFTNKNRTYNQPNTKDATAEKQNRKRKLR